ncbi:MAG TPA: BON domain-containing protein [Stellaceae bacterium]|nr:BON domain-containing protein [Stellaceae bacterium]
MSWFRLGLVMALLTLPMTLGGCVGLLVAGGLGAAAGGGYVVAQERGADGLASDFAIKTDIEKQLIATDPQLQAGVTTTVYNGRVLLTGHLATAQMKAAADGIASRTHDVRTVYDEIEVAPGNLWNEAQDTWISTRIRSEMVADPDIRSVNYTIDTANGSVYLTGSARSQGELDRATRIARYVPGVKRVVSYVELRAGAPYASVPGMPPAGSAPINQGSSVPSASPLAPIEVQKL